MNSALQCTTIAAGQNFAQLLAQWLIARYGQDKAQFVNTLILLPNRRACRTLREAFLRQNNGMPMLLPRISPIGDMEEDPLTLWNTASEPPLPAISPMRRHLLLTRLVMQFEQQQPGRIYSMAQAAELARQLADFLDEVARHGAHFETLSALAPEALAAHWQQTVDFLRIVSHHWPKILEKEGVSDPVEHRNALLLATAKSWQDTPPGYPVIAAGSTGSQPATAKLLATIARMPLGMVVLPGLDAPIEDKAWELLEPTHPQYGIKQLLEAMHCKRSQVKLLGDHEDVQRARGDCLRRIFDPPAMTAHWSTANAPLAEGFRDIRMATADTLLAEARVIAIAMREALETPGKTASLVTPDRSLARMVTAQMQRFGIAIDDSAGMPLSATPPAIFLRLAVELAQSAAAPNALLALLRHPLAAAGVDAAQCRAFSRLLDKHLLRGIRHASGIAPLRKAAAGHPELAKFLGNLLPHYETFARYFSDKKPVAFSELLAAHIAFAQYMASTAAQNGEQLLWSGHAGNQLAAFLGDIAAHADLLPPIDPLTYPGLLETLLAGQIYRPAFGQHPRLSIVSPMEARLQQFDLVILGSLNEGSWPGAPGADPWMSRPMREAFGLPALEREIGQSAHDFHVLCHAKEVLLTRARKVAGTPTIPSRWLTRLTTFVGGHDAGLLARMDVSADYAHGAKLFDAPKIMSPLAPPAPTPPVSARPRNMRVTAIDTWLRDPYMIYAQYILGLKKLAPLDEDPDAADFGTLIHAAIESFGKRWLGQLPPDAYAALLDCGRECFAAFADRPAVACLWWPRFEAIGTWYIEQEMQRRSLCSQVYSERKGRWEFAIGGKPFALSTRIDRLEARHDGSLVIADYKTGSLPEKKDIEHGLANQLGLEALVAMHGALNPPIPHAGTIAQMEYWKLSGNREQYEIVPIVMDLEATRQRLEALVMQFDNPDQPYFAQTNGRMLTRYNDYAHLTRRQEWEEV
jgi:ATP-dependent helicase/nuclease subunit B